jgi:hypothetical protein
MRSKLRCMTSLHELQSRLLDALLSASAEAQECATAECATANCAAAVALIDAPAPAAAARLAVYRNTVWSNVVGALRSTYPAVWRLVGEDYFLKVAREFIVRHPSTCGDLTPVGALFPAYLAQLHDHGEYGYLAEVARFEWLIQEALLCLEHPPFDLTRLAGVAPAAYDGLRFVLHPALHLFESRYPVRRIWESNVGSAAEPQSIDLAVGGERLALLQQRLQLHFHALTTGEWCWLEALQGGETFAASVEAALASDGAFDAVAALRRFVSIGAIVDF